MVGLCCSVLYADLNGLPSRQMTVGGLAVGRFKDARTGDNRVGDRKLDAYPVAAPSYRGFADGSKAMVMVYVCPSTILCTCPSLD